MSVRSRTHATEPPLPNLRRAATCDSFHYLKEDPNGSFTYFAPLQITQRASEQRQLERRRDPRHNDEDPQYGVTFRFTHVIKPQD